MLDLKISSEQNKKIVAAIILAGCAVVAVILFYMSATNSVHGPFARLTTPPATGTVEENYFDSDADGLADIEEKDFGTNAENADSDGDGYLDGEEVAQDTDPLTAESVPAAESIRSLLAEQDAGDNMSRDFVGNILGDVTENDRLFWTETATSDLVQLHLSYTPETAEDLAQQLSDQFLQAPDITDLRNIPDAELHITNDLSKASVNAYVTSYMDIIGNVNNVDRLRSYYERLMENATDMGIAITPSLRNETESEIIPMLKETEQALRTLSVPETWTELHKDQIAFIAGQRTALKYLMDAKGDLMKQYYAMALLQKVQEDSNIWKEQATALLNS